MAVDLRGYGRSDSPRGVRAYSSDAVVSDITSLLTTLRCDVAAAVVGHDWGARVAWAVAEAAPERIARLITLNVPHPLVFTRTLRTSAQQRKRSWYIAAFQLPLLPEALLSSRDCAPLRRMLRTGAAEPLPPALEEAHVALFRRSGFTPPLNYYRAAARGLWPSSGARVDVPTLVLWVRVRPRMVFVCKRAHSRAPQRLQGERDAYLEASMADVPPELAPNTRVVRFATASHWVQWDEPAAVNTALLAFLREPVAGDMAAPEAVLTAAV